MIIPDKPRDKSDFPEFLPWILPSLISNLFSRLTFTRVYNFKDLKSFCRLFWEFTFPI